MPPKISRLEWAALLGPPLVMVLIGLLVALTELAWPHLPDIMDGALKGLNLMVTESMPYRFPMERY
jgi:hypothetical protein